MMKIRRIFTTNHEDQGLWLLKDGTKAFIKISTSNVRSTIGQFKTGYNREKVCLEVLQKLAVPKILKFNPIELPHFKNQKNIHCLALSYVGKHTSHELKLKPFEMVGVWLFVAEQLAAFRRHQILYCDLKCGNIMGQRKPLNISIIDFDGCLPLDPSQKYLENYKYTLGFCAPEVLREQKVTEQSLVYQEALLLFHFLTNGHDKNVDNVTFGLKKAVEILKRMDASDLAKLMTLCLSVNPKKRPKNYEEVLEKIKVCNIPTKILKVWTHLRKPYAKYLAEINL